MASLDPPLGGNLESPHRATNGLATPLTTAAIEVDECENKIIRRFKKSSDICAAPAFLLSFILSDKATKFKRIALCKINLLEKISNAILIHAGGSVENTMAHAVYTV